jgi:hypothetical protein
MTSPVLARPVEGQADSWNIDFFVPASIFGSNYAGIPTADDISIVNGTDLVFAITEFPGFASESEFKQYQGNLTAAMAEAGLAAVPDTPWSTVWAQYDSPFTLFNRHNEVWLRVANSEGERGQLSPAQPALRGSA